MFRMNGMSRAHKRKSDDVQENEAFNAPRQLLRHCSNWIHPFNNAETTLPPSMAAVCDGPIDALV